MFDSWAMQGLEYDNLAIKILVHVPPEDVVAVSRRFTYSTWKLRVDKLLTNSESTRCSLAKNLRSSFWEAQSRQCQRPTRTVPDCGGKVGNQGKDTPRDLRVFDVRLFYDLSICFLISFDLQSQSLPSRYN